MEQLSHALHAATADPPPSSIDLDQIIAGQGRRVRLQSRAGAIAAVAVLGAVAMTVPSLLATHQGGRTSVAGGPSAACAIDGPSMHPVPLDQSGNPVMMSPVPGSSQNPPPPGNGGVSESAVPPGNGGVSESAVPPPIVDNSPTNVPQPTEDCAAAEQRLNRDVMRLLHQDVPAARISFWDGGTSMFVRFQAQAGYIGSATIVTDAGTFGLSAMLYAELPGSESSCDSQFVAGRPCTTDPDGTVVITSGSGETPGVNRETAILQRADGTRISLGLSPGMQQGEVRLPLPLTVDQLADIGRALTLFP